MNRAGDRIDLRLLPVALGLWLAESLVLFCSGRAGRMWLVLRLSTWCVGAALLMGAAAGRGTWRLAVAVTGCAVLAGCGLASLRTCAIAAQPLAAMAKQHAVVSAEVRLVTAPTFRTASTSGAVGSPDAVGTDSIRWRATANVRRIDEGNRRWDLRMPVVVQGSARSHREVGVLVPGVVLKVRASVSQPQPARPVAAILSVRGPPVVVARAPWWQSAGDRVRVSIRDASIGLSADVAGLLPGLTVGDVNGVPPDLAADMRLVGMSHLTAVSGSNLAIVVGLVFFLAARLRLRRWIAAGLALGSMVAFIVVVGPQPSILRAGAMATIALAALVMGRGHAGVSGLLAATVLLLLIDPWLALSAGFALSVCATGGLLVWAMRQMARETLVLSGYEQARRGAIDACGIALAAQLATAPIVAGLGSGIALVGIPANVLVAPAVPVVTILGLAAAVLGTVAPAGAHLLAAVAAVPTQWIAFVARSAVAVPGGVMAWPSGLTGALALAAVSVGVLALVLAVRKRLRQSGIPPDQQRRRALRLAAPTAAAVVAIATIRPSAFGAEWPPQHWLAVICDVGQGDASVIATSPHHAMVIDAGPEPRAADRCLRDLGVSTIDMLVLTHFHADHVEGLPGLLGHRSIGRIVVSPFGEPVGEVHRVSAWLLARQLKMQVASVGEQGSLGSLTYRILWPDRIIHGQGSDPNNASVALLVSIGPVRLLMTGDIEPAAQAQLISMEPPMHADVIKIPHHGSRNQDPDLIQWSGARLAVISVGAKNRYGHPAQPTIESWRQAGASVARTDQNGAVAVVTGPDGAPRLQVQRNPS